MAGLAVVLMDDSPMPVRWNPGQAPSASSGIQPVLRLEKPRYALGESIRFWVGVQSKDSTKVAEALRKPCSLTTIRPDGSTKIESVRWRLDGIHGADWTGGWGFGDDTVQEGTYTLDLECGIGKTPPVNLIVEQNEIADQVKVQFLFPRGSVANIRGSSASGSVGSKQLSADDPLCEKGLNGRKHKLTGRERRALRHLGILLSSGKARCCVD